MKYQCTKRYSVKDAQLTADANWAYEHLGPSFNPFKNPQGVWDTPIVRHQYGERHITYAFTYKEDYVMFILACGNS